jgi:hypothetical protein
MRMLLAVLVCGWLCGCASTPASKADKPFADSFAADKADFASVGKNKFFILEPGYYLVLENKSGSKTTVLTITVLKETKMVDGVETRVVEEKETVNGVPEEISRNYFAIAKKTGDVYYFGEDVDEYKKGKVVAHGGSWLSGVGGAKYGLMMPGTPVVGAKYQQEIAPKVAMDRAEIISLTETFETPAGRFEGCLKTLETSAIESAKEYKVYAPDIGLISDTGMKLTKYGRLPQ